jgi:hypothetical protein
MVAVAMAVAVATMVEEPFIYYFSLSREKT